MPKRHQIGGSFAPPLDVQKLAHYRQLADTADAPTKDAMLKLCTMMEQWHAQPASIRAGNTHPSGVGLIIPLENATIDSLWDHVPWDYECNAIGQLFEKLDPVNQRDLRNAAFHLLWFAKELTQDREPITADQLQRHI